jgi:hypothetical protein
VDCGRVQHCGRSSHPAPRCAPKTGSI